MNVQPSKQIRLWNEFWKRKSKKRKYLSFTNEDRATIGKFATENGNTAAVKRFKVSHNVGESTVRNCKIKYLRVKFPHCTVICCPHSSRPFLICFFNSARKPFQSVLVVQYILDYPYRDYPNPHLFRSNQEPHVVTHMRK